MNNNILCNNNVLQHHIHFTITDANGCTASASGLVNDVAGPIVSVTSQTNVSCLMELMELLQQLLQVVFQIIQCLGLVVELTPKRK